MRSGRGLIPEEVKRFKSRRKLRRKRRIYKGHQDSVDTSPLPLTSTLKGAYNLAPLLHTRQVQILDVRIWRMGSVISAGFHCVRDWPCPQPGTACFASRSTHERQCLTRLTLKICICIYLLNSGSAGISHPPLFRVKSPRRTKLGLDPGRCRIGGQ
jgi:hypothetical protein